MRAGPGVSEEGANLICRFRRKNVLKLAGLLLDFRLAIHRQAVGEKAFGETVAADDAAGAFTASRSEFHDQCTVPCRRRHRLKRFMAGIHKGLVIVRMRRMRCRDDKPHLDHLLNRQADRKRAVDLHALDFSNLAVFGQHPELFEHLVQLLFIGHGKDFLRLDPAMVELDAAVGQACHDGVMRHHHDGPSLLMKLAQQPQHNLLVLRVEVARRLVRQNDFRVIDESSCDAHPLLLTS